MNQSEPSSKPSEPPKVKADLKRPGATKGRGGPAHTPPPPPRKVSPHQPLSEEELKKRNKPKPPHTSPVPSPTTTPRSRSGSLQGSPSGPLSPSSELNNSQSVPNKSNRPPPANGKQNEDSRSKDQQPAPVKTSGTDSKSGEAASSPSKSQDPGDPLAETARMKPSEMQSASSKDDRPKPKTPNREHTPASQQPATPKTAAPQQRNKEKDESGLHQSNGSARATPSHLQTSTDERNGSGKQEESQSRRESSKSPSVREQHSTPFPNADEPLIQLQQEILVLKQTVGRRQQNCTDIRVRVDQKARVLQDAANKKRSATPTAEAEELDHLERQLDAAMKRNCILHGKLEFYQNQRDEDFRYKQMITAAENIIDELEYVATRSPDTTPALLAVLDVIDGSTSARDLTDRKLASEHERLEETKKETKEVHDGCIQSIADAEKKYDTRILEERAARIRASKRTSVPGTTRPTKSTSGVSSTSKGRLPPSKVAISSNSSKPTQQLVAGSNQSIRSNDLIRTAKRKSQQTGGVTPHHQEKESQRALHWNRQGNGGSRVEVI